MIFIRWWNLYDNNITWCKNADFDNWKSISEIQKKFWKLNLKKLRKKKEKEKRRCHHFTHIYVKNNNYFLIFRIIHIFLFVTL